LEVEELSEVPEELRRGEEKAEEEKRILEVAFPVGGLVS
jgi:hypothetical protein